MNQAYAKLETGSIRANKDLEAAVNRGLAASLLDGVAAGAELMHQEGVPLHVSTRVLSSTEPRRASDWQQNALLQEDQPDSKSF